MSRSNPMCSCKATSASTSPESSSRPCGSPGTSRATSRFTADGALFSGDVLFAGSVGRTDRPDGDWDTLLDSIRRLLERFPPETLVYSGHGPPTTLGDELARNPFLAELAPPREVRGSARHPRRPRQRQAALAADLLREFERLCVSTATARSTRRSSRTPSSSRAHVRRQGSDVVRRRCTPSTDRGDRSLTLRAEATAPIVRAYLEHGLHREPQPQKLFTIAPIYRYGAPAARALPRALAADRRGDRLRRTRRSTPR